MKMNRGDRVILTRDFYPTAWSFKIPKGTRDTVVEANESIFGNSYKVRFEGRNDAVEMNQTAMDDACAKA